MGPTPIFRGGRFRWLVSTCLAAAVGVLAILVVIAGFTDTRGDGRRHAVQPAARARRTARLVPATLRARRWAALGDPEDRPAADPERGHGDQVRHSRCHAAAAGEPRLHPNKPYARLVARLAPITKAEAQSVPPFNPFKLYANTTPLDAAEPSEDGQQDAAVKIVELLGGAMPSEDGQELSTEEVADVVSRVLAQAISQPCRGQVSQPIRRAQRGAIPCRRPRCRRAAAANTSVLAKSVLESEDPTDDLAGREVRVVKAVRGDTLARILLRLGAETWQARAMTDAARNALPDGALQPGQEMHVTLVPSVIRANRMEPIRVSVFGEGHDHKVTVTRNAAGEFVSSASPIDERVLNAEVNDDERPQASTSGQPAAHGRAAGCSLGHDPADPQDPCLRDGLPPASARRRLLRVLLRRKG